MIRMIDIAREVGVSRTAVSFVLNGKHKEMRLSEPIIRKIRETAERMGYVPNELVNTVVKGKSNVIAVISKFSDFILPAIHGCVDEAVKYDYIIKLIPVEKNINEAILKAIKFRVAGIFAISLEPELIDQVDSKFFNYGIPSIGLTPHTGRMMFDQQKSAQKGTEYLLSLGHRNIVFFGTSSVISQEREEGYKKAMTEKGLPLQIIRTEEEEIPEKTDLLLQADPDAVQCSNDSVALLLMHECYSRRIFIPETFSILGFGNIPACRLSAPFLSTVDEPYYQTGRIMFRQIYDLLSGNQKENYEYLCGDVIPRETTVALKQQKGEK